MRIAIQRFGRILLMIVALANLGISANAATPTAASAATTLKKAVAKLTNASGLSVDFNVTSPKPLKGSFKSCGGKFAITSPASSVWYNGTHMWTYNPSSGEATQVRPSAEELAETNPLLYIASHGSQFKAEYGKAPDSAHTTLILTPVAKDAPVTRAVLTLNAKTLLPTKLSVKMQGSVCTLSFSNIHTSGIFPASDFQFPAKKYPGVKVVKL